jgi:hypothetical protein
MMYHHPSSLRTRHWTMLSGGRCSVRRCFAGAAAICGDDAADCFSFAIQRDTGCCSTLPSSLPLPSNFMPLPLLWRLQELLLMQRDRTHCHVHSFT